MNTHSKHIIELLQTRTVLFSNMSNIWENTNVCAEQYCYVTSLYLSSLLAHAYYIIIDSGVLEPGHGREVVGGLNATKNGCFKR